MHKKLLILIVPFFFTAILIFGFSGHTVQKHQNSNGKQYKFHETKGELPVIYNDLFAGSGVCKQCHDQQENQQGESVSIVADWRSTMMANASKDPFWRAKVSHEGLVNPAHKEELENVCTRCHATAGHENAHYNGQALYSIEDMESDPLALDGVQCTVCHQIKESSFGQFSGAFEIGTEKIIWGPFESPFANPMINMTGYTPQYSDHINDSRLCASCHTLITNSVDNNGIPTGNEFVEQSIYQEWLNSNFPESGISCQICHLPRIDDEVKISSMPPWLDPRTPFAQHHLAGANVFMLNILKDHGEEIGVTATNVHFDSAIVRNYRMLQQNTLNITLTEIVRTSDTLFLKLELANQTGHKFPGGYPSRRVFIEIVVKNDDDQVIFHSGAMDENYQLLDDDEDYEPHYTMINEENQVQIYEMVMGDINHEVTTVLERANFNLKDNRIPPSGFTTSHYTYDTVAIYGNASTDPDFNKLNGVEGSGIDIVYFHIPTNENSGELNVTVKVHYQTVSAKWLEHMFSYSSDEINLFKGYFEEANKEPVQVAESSLTSLATLIDEESSKSFQIYPNPTTGLIRVVVGELEPGGIDILSNTGRLISNHDLPSNGGIHSIQMPDEKGLYYLKVKTKGSILVQKVLVY